MDISQVEERFFVRMKGSVAADGQKVKELFGDAAFVEADDLEGEFAFVTGVMTEAAYQEKAQHADGIISMIRARF